MKYGARKKRFQPNRKDCKINLFIYTPVDILLQLSSLFLYQTMKLQWGNFKTSLCKGE